jgi:hypothetical protein
MTQAAGTFWGTGVWGEFLWASAANIPKVYNIAWTIPLVFQKMSIDVTVTSSQSVSIGTFFARYADTGYTNRS